MLPNLSKLFEYVINERLTSHVESTGLIVDNQHGFRTGRSCSTAHVVLTQDIFKSLEKRNTIVIACFIDIKQAFQNILHCLLIEDLVHIFKVPSGLVLIIFSFLSEREFVIKIGNFMSQSFKDGRGTAQGTVNGPLLFVLFFNKVATILSDCWLAFADDLLIYIECTNVSDGLLRMQTSLLRLDAW